MHNDLVTTPSIYMLYLQYTGTILYHTYVYVQFTGETRALALPNILIRAEK